MLKSKGRPPFVLKLGSWLCACMRKRQLSDGLKQRLRPRAFGRFACWCDRSDHP